MKIKLSSLQSEYLLNFLCSEKLTSLDFRKSSKEQDRKLVELSLSTDSIDQLRDLLLAKFDVVGLDQNYQLTEEGRLLEDLSDLLLI